jgi:hypothetical protein
MVTKRSQAKTAYFKSPVSRAVKKERRTNSMLLRNGRDHGLIK